ncbi:unnamed protein product [Notodromas monacha]|uniref:Arrestin C-terminal-like domain-containing protein n=1 Tax=Notodromas monacha TaxID=399045 RepID=A0A7R9BM14_9CRUS|nr:unnamed protein product [Notodromas monacha]CAG0917136.1 unnamed protein product [Notodromas monacha]
MLELLGLFVFGTVALKVFKKSSPNGKLTVYLGKRDFVDHLGKIDPIDGVVVVDTDYLQGRKVFGLEKLIKKLGANAYPFFFELPATSPTSVTLQPGTLDSGKPLGVEYDLKTWIAESKEEKPHRRSSVSMAIRKVQYAPVEKGSRQPSAIVSKGFALATGKINLEVTLDKDIYYHGERITANVRVSNNSRKTVKCFKVGIIQHCEVTVVNAQFSREVASLQTKEGCPITPGASLNKQFFLTPVAGELFFFLPQRDLPA